MAFRPSEFSAKGQANMKSKCIFMRVAAASGNPEISRNMWERDRERMDGEAG